MTFPLEKALELVEQGHTKKRVAELLGYSQAHVSNKLRYFATGDGIPEAVLQRKQRLSEIPTDTRNLTQRICGDPLPGRSALDMRNL